MNNDMNNTKDSALSLRIMRRVYLVASIRALLNPVFLKSLFVVVFFWRSTQYVSYANVIANAPSLLDIESNIRFFSSALAHTRTMTMFLCLGIATMLTWIAFDMARHKTHAWF